MSIRLSVLSSWFSMALLAGSSFILIPIFLHTLGTEKFGFFIMLYTISDYLGLGVGWLGGVGSRLIGLYEARNETGKVSQISTLTILVFLFYGIVLFLIGSMTSFFFPLGSESFWTLLAFSLFLLLTFPFHALTSLLFAMNHQVASHGLKSAQIAIYVLLAFFGISMFPSIFTPFLAMSGSLFIGLILAWLMRSRFFFTSPSSLDRETVHEVVIKVGVWTFLYGALLLTFFLDTVFLGIFGSVEMVSQYTVFWQIPNFFTLLLWRYSETLHPFYVRLESAHKENDLGRMFHNNIMIVLGLSLVFNTIFFFFGNAFLAFWVGAKSAASLGLPMTSFQFLLIISASIFLALDRVFSILLFSFGELKRLCLILVITVFLKFGMAVILLPSLGAFSTLAAYSMAFLLFSSFAYGKSIIAFFHQRKDPEALRKAVQSLYEKIPFLSSEKNFFPIFKSLQIPEADLPTFFRGKGVAEIGCGAGHISSYLGSKAKHVTGVDISEHSLEQAHLLAKEKNLSNMVFSRGDLFDPAFLQQHRESYDFVLCYGVLHHTVNAGKGFENLTTLVKPGGFLLVGVYSRTMLRYRLQRFILSLFCGDDVAKREKMAKRFFSANDPVEISDRFLHPLVSFHSPKEVFQWGKLAGLRYHGAWPKIGSARHPILFPFLEFFWILSGKSVMVSMSFCKNDSPRSPTRS